MLYQTHHLHFFPFHHHLYSLTSSSSIPLSATTTRNSSPASSLLSSSSSTSLAKEMECVEAALKTSIRKEMALKSSPQVLLEDLWALNPQNVVPGDDFFVDDLLDFSNEDNFVEEEEKQENAVVSVSTKQEQKEDENNTTGSPNFDDFGPIPAGELAVPTDDVENLEWLSHFVEDSFSEFSAPFPAGTLPAKPKVNESERKTLTVTKPCFTTPVPAKGTRSKRTRTGGRVWSLGSPSFTESSSSSSNSSSSSSPSSPWLTCTNPGSVPRFEPYDPGSSGKPVMKKQKKKHEGSSGGSVGQLPRRCSHCGVQKTPQWRTGPLGAKTLCNACGVRYKSGRLLPEYRPACSPTFSSELHSNHHRKVLEMRRKKDSGDEAEPSLTPPVVPVFEALGNQQKRNSEVGK